MVVVAGQVLCLVATALLIAALCHSAWIFRCRLLSRVPGDGGTGWSGGSGGCLGGRGSVCPGWWEHQKEKLVVGEGSWLCGDGSDWWRCPHQQTFPGSLLFEPLLPTAPPPRRNGWPGSTMSPIKIPPPFKRTAKHHLLLPCLESKVFRL